jgi:hypothetical protein
MANNYALVLTGAVLPGFTAESVWPELAACLGMGPEKLAQLVARAPKIIQQNNDLDKMQACQARIARIGAQTEIVQLGAAAAKLPGQPQNPALLPKQPASRAAAIPMTRTASTPA